MLNNKRKYFFIDLFIYFKFYFLTELSVFLK